jgi:hypothetical protein
LKIHVEFVAVEEVVRVDEFSKKTLVGVESFILRAKP